MKTALQTERFFWLLRILGLELTFTLRSFVQFKTAQQWLFSFCSRSVHNTLYLEVHCPAVRPHIVVVSDCGRAVVDFANVSLGKNERWIYIQVMSFKTMSLGWFLLISANKCEGEESDNRAKKKILCRSKTKEITPINNALNRRIVSDIWQDSIRTCIIWVNNCCSIGERFYDWTRSIPNWWRSCSDTTSDWSLPWFETLHETLSNYVWNYSALNPVRGKNWVRKDSLHQANCVSLFFSQGQCEVKSFTIQNISDEPLQVSASL